jgi:hypothetical protein
VAIIQLSIAYDMGICRGCHAPIQWRLTQAGRRMPMNEGTVHLKVLPDEPGKPQMGEFSTDDVHWASCPEAKAFKRKRR